MENGPRQVHFLNLRKVKVGKASRAYSAINHHGGDGGPPPADSSSASDSSSGTTSANDILQQFLQSLQNSLPTSSSASYGATGASDPADSSPSFSALLIDYQT